MTLATFLIVGILYTATATAAATGYAFRDQNAAPASSGEQGAPTAQQSQSQQAPDPGTGAAPTSTAPDKPNAAPRTTKPPAKPSAKKKAAAHRRHKRVARTNCPPPAVANPANPAAPGSVESPSGTASAASPDPMTPGATTAAPADGAAKVPNLGASSTNCPPTKVIVRHGGTAEHSIQLAGGSGSNQQSRDNANQMLAVTQQNLKQLSGRQLSTNQQELVNQIDQFVKQSKGAAAAGDHERARTLAWKAQLLSEDLIKPPK